MTLPAVLCASFAGVMALPSALHAQESPSTSPRGVREDPDAGDPARGVEEGDPRIHAQTGRLIARWPKDQWFDYDHIRVELDIPDISTPIAAGQVTITARPIGYNLLDMELDCSGPLPTDAWVNGARAQMVLSQGKILVKFPAAVSPGQTVKVTVAYTLDFAGAKGEGLTWCAGDPEATSATAREPMIHAQGQAELNSRWFPCFDSPLDRCTSEVIVETDDGFLVVSNGRLMGTSSASKGAKGQPRTRWHWAISKPHVPYLITLGIGKWSIVELGGPDSARPGLPMPVYAFEGLEDVAREAFAGTPDMVRFFETRFDEPYPWEQYAQVLVRCFAAGGMENTGATFLSARSGTTPGRGRRDSLVSHELAHQWFGDLLTCRSWDHLWLNEGWATYCEALWNEEKTRQKDGDEAARKVLIEQMRRSVERMARRRELTSPEQPALVSNRYQNPDAVFSKRDNPYSKGALLLHMLRMRLGDEVFFEGAKRFIDTHKFQQVETNDFRVVMEDVSGLSLERFFDQWALRPGMARVRAEARATSPGVLNVRMEQTQRIDRHNPAYFLDVPVRITDSSGRVSTLTFTLDERVREGELAIPVSAAKIEFDPDITLLASFDPREVDLASHATAIEHTSSPEPTAVNSDSDDSSAD